MGRIKQRFEENKGFGNVKYFYGCSYKQFIDNPFYKWFSKLHNTTEDDFLETFWGVFYDTEFGFNWMLKHYLDDKSSICGKSQRKFYGEPENVYEYINNGVLNIYIHAFTFDMLEILNDEIKDVIFCLNVINRLGNIHYSPSLQVGWEYKIHSQILYDGYIVYYLRSHDIK